MEYLFVFANGGWWLKIDSADKLVDYHRQTNVRISEAFDLFSQLHEEAGDVNKIMDVVASYPTQKRLALMQTRAYKIMQAAMIEAGNIGGNIFDGFRCLNMEVGSKELRDIHEYGATYINRVGGSTFGLEYTQFYRSKKLVFPDFRREDIRVKQYTGGNHWYAYVGDMQVRDGDTLKWDSYEEAYNRALALVE